MIKWLRQNNNPITGNPGSLCVSRNREHISPKLCARIKDNNDLPHGKFHRFLLPFSSEFSDLNFFSFLLYIAHVMLRDTHIEPGLSVVQ